MMANISQRRRSTLGLAIDFPTSNIVGFTCYTVSTAAFLYSPLIRSQYASRHPASPVPTVRFNDFAFALHGVILCIITYSQFWPSLWGFQVGSRQTASPAILGFVWGGIAGVIIIALFVVASGEGGAGDATGWAWLEVIYAVSYVKLIATVIKYIPQLWVNYKRKATSGWSIDQIILDFAGGILSLVQLVIDSALQADWSGIQGNPVKLGLSNVSILFDIIFMTQHYYLYRDAARVEQPGKPDDHDADPADERTPLLTR